jgi:hypothetical protein
MGGLRRSQFHLSLEQRIGWAPVAHACNPNSGGRDRKDQGLKPAQAES